MPALIDLTNQRFGRWLVTGLAPRRLTNSSIYWLCRCDCGTVSEVEGNSLRRNLTSSCGCFQKETKTTHGQYKSPTYNSWDNMIGRCYRVTHPDYCNYGGRGIMVCDRWRQSYQNFIQDMGERPADMTLDRKNVNGHYEPSNCKWSTNQEQQNNKQNSLRIPYQGRMLTFQEYSEITGIPVTTLRNRKHQGVSLDSLHLTPKQAGL